MATTEPRFYIRKQAIQNLVIDLLNKFNLNDTSPVPVEDIVRQLGIELQYVANTDDQLSGFIYRDATTGKTILGVNADHSENRQRFTIAHELGHFLLHPLDEVLIDRKGYGYGYGRLRSLDSSSGEFKEEREANLFAAELLMPEAILRKKAYEATPFDFIEEDDDNIIRTLASDFGVSPQSLTIRLVQLGLLNS